MKLLLDFINKNEPYETRRDKTFSHSSATSLNIKKLKKLLAEGLIKSEADITRYFMKSEGSSINAVRLLKHRMLDHLIDSLFFIDTSKMSKRDAILYKANRYYFIVSVCVPFHNRSIVKFFAKKAFQIASIYQSTHIMLETAKILQNTHALLHERSQFLFYSKIVQDLSSLRTDELTADYYDDLISMEHSKRKFEADQLEHIEQYIEGIENHAPIRSSFILTELHFRIRFKYYYSIRMLYKTALDVCQQAIDYSKSIKNLKNNRFISEFHYRTIICCIHLKEYQKAISSSIQCATIIKSGSYNWCLLQRLIIMIHIHQIQFYEAYTKYASSLSLINWKKLPSQLKMEWNILLLYIRYCLVYNWIIGIEGQYQLQIDLTELLEKRSFYSRDSTSSNISILVAQVMYLLEDGNFDEISNRVESLRLYVYRYLNKPETVRSKLFIKLLLIMDKHSYNYKAVQKASEKTFTRLLEETPDKQPGLEEAEIIPYDLLWPRILERLNHFSNPQPL